MNVRDTWPTILATVAVAILVATGMLLLIIYLRNEVQSPERKLLGYTEVDRMNHRCWYRAVGDWRPGTIRHWVTGEAVAVVEDQETGYCHTVDLENINFRQLKPW